MVKVTLPFEATSQFLIDEEVERNAAMQDFMANLTPYEAERFMQFLHHVGYITFMDGLRRPVGQSELTLENQASVLSHETSLFLQGATEYARYLDE